jgi:hypothetical protein
MTTKFIALARSGTSLGSLSGCTVKNSHYRPKKVRPISDEKIREIRKDLEELSLKAVATKHNIAEYTIRSIRGGWAYADVE